MDSLFPESFSVNWHIVVIFRGYSAFIKMRQAVTAHLLYHLLWCPVNLSLTKPQTISSPSVAVGACLELCARSGLVCFEAAPRSLIQFLAVGWFCKATQHSRVCQKQCFEVSFSWWILLCSSSEDVGYKHRVSNSSAETALWSLDVLVLRNWASHLACVLHDWGYLKTETAGRLSYALGRRQICFCKTCGWGKLPEPGWRRRMLPPATKLRYGIPRWRPWRCRSSALLSS